MTYLARKIRQARNAPFKRIISYEAQNLPLDPLPYLCTYNYGDGLTLRHERKTVCSFFNPRPGCEQDRSKYEN